MRIVRPLALLLTTLALCAPAGSFASPDASNGTGTSAAWLHFPRVMPVGVPTTLSTTAGTLVDVTITTGGNQGVGGGAWDTLGMGATGLAYDSLRYVGIFNGGGNGNVLTTLTFSNIRVGPSHAHGLFLIGAVNGQSSPIVVTSSVPGRVATFNVVGQPFAFNASNDWLIDWIPALGQFQTSATSGNDSRCIVIDLDDLRSDGTIEVSVSQHLNDGILYAFGETVSGSVGVSPPRTPGALALAAPRPNPASESVALAFVAHSSGRVRLEVLDVTGRRVASLLDGDVAAGPHERTWDMRGTDGRRVPPGVMLVRLMTPEGTSTRRLLVVH